MKECIQGWGRFPAIEAEVKHPRNVLAVHEELNATTIARGLGRSYGDSALASNVIAMHHLDHFLSFDETTGILQCEAGISLADILGYFVPRGWFLPVTPGTQFVTVGGAIASDVHGKNHHRDGCFSAWVEDITLMLGNGETVTCSTMVEPQLFRATCGGMGLTGTILRASIRLRRIASAWIAQTSIKASNLAALLTALDMHATAHYSVAWIDCIARGEALGRGILMLGEHAADGGYPTPSAKKLSVPFAAPSLCLNRYSMRAFNALYYAKTRAAETHALVHYEPFFYPLDRIQRWNLLYGKKGFLQYQCVIPKAAGHAALQQLLTAITDSGMGSFLAVLKLLGAENANLLSFPLEGYTLALDFKMQPGVLALLDRLDAITRAAGGRIYLTKDARMSKEMFRAGYPRWEEFQAVREQYHALVIFSSQQSKRLGLS